MEPRTPSRAVKGDPILIIDDDTTAISTLTRILRKGGYSRVLSTAEPQNAPALVSYHRPSLVLLDLNMPEEDVLGKNPRFRLLARKLGGDLSVRSTPGVGSVFTATFATARVPEASLEYSAPNLSTHASHAGAEQRPDLHGMVLLAEDYADNLALISAYIAGSGAQVTLAHQLKGVAGSFGLPEATRAAGMLEGAARGDDEAAVARLLNELEDICQNSLG